jgi:hypothetical protein
MAETKLTKARLLNQMDEKLQRINLLKAALQAEAHIKQETLTDYKKRFDALFMPAKGKSK